MITVMINAKVKKDRLEEFKKLAIVLTKESRVIAGCIAYSFNQSIDCPTDFVLYERWETESDLSLHIKALIALLGPPKSEGLLPEKLVDMYEKADATYYNAIE